MTYSIVGRDPDTGELGVAVQSRAFNAGAAVPWGAPGIGVVATQSYTERSYGPLGLELLRGGKTPEQALEALVAADEEPSTGRWRCSTLTGARRFTSARPASPRPGTHPGTASAPRRTWSRASASGRQWRRRSRARRGRSTSGCSTRWTRPRRPGATGAA